MTVQDFDFGEHVVGFDDHIAKSIPNLCQFERDCEVLSKRFIQPRSRVVDIGCSTGRLLAGLRDYNEGLGRDVQYLGIDREPQFKQHWDIRAREDLRFEVADVQQFDGFEGGSLVLSMFTVQFLPERDKLGVLKRIRDGLLPGGALIIAEKILAKTGRIQDALAYPYYDKKLKYFSEKEILDKERRLRGQMTPWYEDELKRNLRRAGFKEVELMWANFPFAAMLALK